MVLESKIPTIVEPNKDIGAASPHDALADFLSWSQGSVFI